MYKCLAERAIFALISVNAVLWVFLFVHFKVLDFFICANVSEYNFRVEEFEDRNG